MKFSWFHLFYYLVLYALISYFWRGLGWLGTLAVTAVVGFISAVIFGALICFLACGAWPWEVERLERIYRARELLDRARKKAEAEVSSALAPLAGLEKEVDELLRKEQEQKRHQDDLFWWSSCGKN